MSEPRPLHRLFGLSWIDFFQGTPISVETELDLSLKQQFLDLVLIRTAPGLLPRPLPDGFEELAAHNLVTFKSHQEALDGWALCELVGHYVNYRKQVSPSRDDLLRESDLRLFAVCARYPQNLAQQVAWTALREGVYEVQALGLRIRVIVVHQLPLEERNAMLLLFSAREDLLRYGREHYRPHSQETRRRVRPAARRGRTFPGGKRYAATTSNETAARLLVFDAGCHVHGFAWAWELLAFPFRFVPADHGGYSDPGQPRPRPGIAAGKRWLLKRGSPTRPTPSQGYDTGVSPDGSWR